MERLVVDFEDAVFGPVGTLAGDGAVRAFLFGAGEGEFGDVGLEEVLGGGAGYGEIWSEALLGS